MSERKLNQTQGTPLVVELARERVPQRVRVDPPRETRRPGDPGQQAPVMTRIDPSASRRREQRSRRVAPMLKPAGERAPGFQAHAHGPGQGAPADPLRMPDSDRPHLPGVVEVVKVEHACFVRPGAGRPEQGDEGPIPGPRSPAPEAPEQSRYVGRPQRFTHRRTP